MDPFQNIGGSDGKFIPRPATDTKPGEVVSPWGMEAVPYDQRGAIFGQHAFFVDLTGTHGGGGCGCGPHDDPAKTGPAGEEPPGVRPDWTGFGGGAGAGPAGVGWVVAPPLSAGEASFLPPRVESVTARAGGGSSLRTTVGGSLEWTDAGVMTGAPLQIVDAGQAHMNLVNLQSFPLDSTQRTSTEADLGAGVLAAVDDPPAAPGGAQGQDVPTHGTPRELFPDDFPEDGVGAGGFTDKDGRQYGQPSQTDEDGVDPGPCEIGEFLNYGETDPPGYGTGGWWFDAPPGYGYVQYVQVRIWYLDEEGTLQDYGTETGPELDLHKWQKDDNVPWYGDQSAKRGVMADGPSLQAGHTPETHILILQRVFGLESGAKIRWIIFRQDYWTYVVRLSPPRKVLGYYHWFNKVTIDLDRDPPRKYNINDGERPKWTAI